MTRVRRETLRDATSVALTVGAYGVAFGAAGVAAGFSVLQANIVGAAGVTSYTDTLSSAHAFYMVDINP